MRHVGHRPVVTFNILQRDGPAVACNIIRARKNDNYARLQIDYILAKAHQHLRCRLPADAAIHVWLTWEVLGERPSIGNRIAHEHHALFPGLRCAEFLVRGSIAPQVRPIL